MKKNEVTLGENSNAKSSRFSCRTKPWIGTTSAMGRVVNGKNRNDCGVCNRSIMCRCSGEGSVL